MSVSNQDPTQSPVPATVRAYPNPFNPSTTLEFELKQSCNPVIKVYNVRGQLGRVYAPGMLSSGTHKWHFDGKDMRGNELPGGIYLVKMELPGRAVVTRITLMK